MPLEARASEEAEEQGILFTRAAYRSPGQTVNYLFKTRGVGVLPFRYFRDCASTSSALGVVCSSLPFIYLYFSTHLSSRVEHEAARKGVTVKSEQVHGSIRRRITVRNISRDR